MADIDETCKAAIETIEKLQSVIAQGYSFRIQQIDHRIFIFANHFAKGNLTGQGRSLSQAVENLHHSEENL